MRRVTQAAVDDDPSMADRPARAVARLRAAQLWKISIAGLAGSLALAVLGGCASPPPPEAALRGQGVAVRSAVVPCTTTWLVLATVSRCGAGGLRFGVATE